MKRLHRMILAMLPGPFLGWLGLLMFLLLMQFLIRYLPEIAGKGLPFFVIIELISYNLAYMVVLAVPMSVLLATLMTFGRLSETNTYTVIKSSGISLLQLVWPTIFVGLFLTGCMWYFNNEVLPEANFRAKNLWQDIRRKKPGFELQPGVFYDGLNQYSILVQEIPPTSNELIDVIIYDYTGGTQQQAVIKAQRGWIQAVGDGTSVELVLENGEMHRLVQSRNPEEQDRYELLAFARHNMRLDLSDFAFERSDPDDGYRSDRTMRTVDMVHYVDSLMASVAEEQRNLYGVAFLADTSFYTQPLEAHLETDFPADSLVPQHTERAMLDGLTPQLRSNVYRLALEHARTARTEIDNVRRTIEWELQRADRYRVEIHKKFSIAVACLIFALIGAPLGLSVRRGSLGVVAAVAVGIFLFYWVTLVQGEKLADRGFLEPWVGMWIANIITATFGLGMLLYVAFDLRATPRLRKRLRPPASPASTSAPPAPSLESAGIRD
jgi:lipopolysaccharide export system permease protein